MRGIDVDLLLLNCGLHDIKTDPATGNIQVPLERYRENLHAIVNLVKKSFRARLLWVRTTPCDERVHNHARIPFHRFSFDNLAYNEAADRIMKEAGIPVIDLYTFTLNLGPDLYCDHVHFHDHIRQKQAAFLAGWLTAFV